MMLWASYGGGFAYRRRAGRRYGFAACRLPEGRQGRQTRLAPRACPGKRPT